MQPFITDEALIDQRHQALFGKFFLAAVAEAKKAELQIMFGSFEDLTDLNRRHAAGWHPLTPTFDPQFARLSSSNSFCIFGVTNSGEAVAAQAERRFDWSGSNFTEEATSLRLFYADPAKMKGPGEECLVTAPLGRSITGKVVYSGGAWVRPDYRGRSLVGVFSRIGKIYAYARWQPDFIIGLMSEQNWQRGLAAKAGYTAIDWAVDVRNSRMGDWCFALVSMQEACVVDYAAQFLRNVEQKG